MNTTIQHMGWFDRFTDATNNLKLKCRHVKSM